MVGYLSTGFSSKVKPAKPTTPCALDALMRFQDTLAVHNLTQVSVEAVHPKRSSGQPAKSKAKPTDTVAYRLKATLERKHTAQQVYQNQRSRFILATNQLDSQQWPAQKLLQEYKANRKQSGDFEFSRTPYSLPAVSLSRNPKEQKLRKALAQQQQTVLDQKKKPTAKPTCRWIIQKFQGIHLVKLEHLKHISSLVDERDKIIRLLEAFIEPYYASE